MKILKFNLRIFNEGRYLNLETKFHACRSINEDLEIFTPLQKNGGEAPFFENFKIVFDYNNEGVYITLETKFRASRSIIEDFEIFTPPKKKEGGPPFGKL